MELSISVYKHPNPQTKERTSSMFKLPDLSSPPPSIPPGYGTSLYPGENQDPNSSPEKILEEISRKRKSTELATFVKSKVKNYRDIRKKNFHLGKKYCSICSEYSSSVFSQSQVIFHNHNSSKSLRMSSKKVGSLSMFLLQDSTPFVQDWYPTSGSGDFQSTE